MCLLVFQHQTSAPDMYSFFVKPHGDYERCTQRVCSCNQCAYKAPFCMQLTVVLTNGMYNMLLHCQYFSYLEPAVRAV
jgi:hypothetical protein